MEKLSSCKICSDPRLMENENYNLVAWVSCGFVFIGSSLPNRSVPQIGNDTGWVGCCSKDGFHTYTGNYQNPAMILAANKN